VLLKKQLIYKMAISRKRLLSLPEKAMYSDMYCSCSEGALPGKFCFESKYYRLQVRETTPCSTNTSCRANATHHTTETTLGDPCFEIHAFGLEKENHTTFQLFICGEILSIKASMMCKPK